MIVVEEVTPQWVLERCKIEKIVVEKSKVIWSVTNGGLLVFVCGVIQASLMSYGEVWLVVTEDFGARKLSTLRACRKLMEMPRAVSSRLIAHVANERDRRFAEFCGFEFTRVDLMAGEEWARVEI